jgi:hypothetical protein
VRIEFDGSDLMPAPHQLTRDDARTGTQVEDGQ